MSMYLSLGCGVTFNPLQTWQYIRSGIISGAPMFSTAQRPVAILPYMPVGQTGPWVSPSADNAWWYAAARPESAGFAGMWITSFLVEDAETSNDYTIIPGCRPRARLGSRAAAGQVITVEAIAIGRTCCAVRTGIEATKAALRSGACSGSSCTGVTATWLSALPESGAPAGCVTVTLPNETSHALNPGPWRMVSGVALVDDSDFEILDGTGPVCGTCNCAPWTKIRFTLHAAPGQHTNPVTVYSGLIRGPVIDAGCVFELPGGCTTCTELELINPLCPPLTLPPRTQTARSRCLCASVARNRSCFTIDASALHDLFDTVATVTVSAGSTDLQNLTVRFWPEVPAAPYTAYQSCASATGFARPYLPAGSVLTVDGRVGDASVTLAGGAVLPARRGTYDRAGLPFNGCLNVPSSRMVCCIDWDADATAVNASITIKLSQVEP